MDENLTQPSSAGMGQAMQPNEGAPTPTPPTPQTTQVMGGLSYAGFGHRLGAFLIDMLIFFAFGFAVGLVLALVGIDPESESWSVIQPMFTLASWVYLVYFDVKTGATLGKKVVGLRVRNINEDRNPTLGEAILRETVGRILSGIPLALGYFWMLFDDKKQTWHDKLGSTVVIKVEK